MYEAAWHRLGFGFALAYHDILLNAEANETAAEFIRRKIASVIDKPALRERRAVEVTDDLSPGRGPLDPDLVTGLDLDHDQVGA